ncbi:MAG: hypothetical protein WC807_12840 [Hyphomicrobium sp.]|jgi:hypothetical protein
MSSDDDGDKKTAQVVPFPFSRVAPAQSGQGDEPVHFGTFAKAIGAPREQTTGHWCSQCRRIWYGYLLEVACPTCGNRHG